MTSATSPTTTPEITPTTDATHPALLREIRRWDFVALVLNAIIGAGIFGLPSKAFALAGSYSLLAFLVCAIVTILIIFCFAEIGSRFSGTGGPYLYAREAFGSFVGFQVGWLMWLTRLTAFASLCNLAVDYFSYFAPAAKTGGLRNAIVCFIVFALTAINLLGVRYGARVSNFLTIGKLVPLILFIAIGLFFIDRQAYSFEARPAFSSFSQAVMVLVFAFSGFEAAVIPAGEGKDPKRHIPFALLTGTAVVVVLYLLIQFVCIGTLPELADSQRPLLDSANRFMGRTGAIVITIGALISISGTLNSITLVAPRLLFAMADDRQLPRPLANTHARFRTPYVAILVSSVVTLLLTLFHTFASALSLSTIIRLIVYAATCAALPVLRKQQGTTETTFLAPAGVIVSILATVLCIALLTNSSGKELRDVAIAAGVGAAINLIMIAVRRR